MMRNRIIAQRLAGTMLAALCATLPTICAAATHAAQTRERAVFAGGCFWGVAAVFESVRGVTGVVAGYAGGTTVRPTYEEVSSGSTGHAESVEVTFDPAKVSYTTLLDIFFTVAHDPTEVDRQGPDEGTQYRSAVFFESRAQQKAAVGAIASLNMRHVFSRPIATTVAPLVAFYPAEAYHQHYAHTHPYNPYILINDAPKVAALRRNFPSLYEPYRS